MTWIKRQYIDTHTDTQKEQRATMGMLKYPCIRTLCYLPVYILGIPIVLLMVLKGLFYNGPRWLFYEKERRERPACMQDPQLGTHKFVQVKNLKLHVVESGDPKNPLMLFLHGFPECWYSWRHQIRAFNKDYHCVAFDMRGVGESDGPPGKRNYTSDLITGDVCELIQVLGHETCILVGHDWGGLIGWKFAAQYPQMVERYIAMNIPHPDRFSELLTFHLPQIIMSWYIFFFQIPWFPERAVKMGDYNMIDEECKHGETTDEDIQAFKYSISRPGRTHTFLNYYRNELTLLFNKTGVVKTPTLLIWGTADNYLHTKLSYDTEKFCPSLKVERIEGGNHFIQQDKPDLVNQLMRKYLERDITLKI